MARMPLTDEMAASLAARVAGFAAEAPEKWRWLIPYVAEFAALPLYLGWGEIIGLRADGEVVSWSTEGEFAGTRPADDPTWRLISLVEGARLYPELRPLLPVRGPAAIDCPCHAHAMFVSGGVICGECGGLGWLPGTGQKGLFPG